MPDKERKEKTEKAKRASGWIPSLFVVKILWKFEFRFTKLISKYKYSEEEAAKAVEEYEKRWDKK